MENKEYKVLVEKNIKLPLLIIIYLAIYVAYSLTTDIQILFHLESVDLNLLGLLIFGAEMIFLANILDKHCILSEEVRVIFLEKEVVFIRNKKERVIPYDTIKCITKLTVISQYHMEKGYYKVAVRVRGKNYKMFSGERLDLQLDFEQTEISKIYYEFKSRGIKCC